MDPVSMALIAGLAEGVASSATEIVGKKAIVDAYETLKAALKRRFGANSDVVEAVEHLEKKPEAQSRRAGVEEEVKAVQAYKDPEVLKAAQALLDQLQAQPGGSTIITQRAGDNAVQVGQVGGDATIKGDFRFGEPRLPGDPTTDAPPPKPPKPRESN